MGRGWILNYSPANSEILVEKGGGGGAKFWIILAGRQRKQLVCWTGQTNIENKTLHCILYPTMQKIPLLPSTVVWFSLADFVWLQRSCSSVLSCIQQCRNSYCYLVLLHNFLGWFCLVAGMQQLYTTMHKLPLLPSIVIWFFIGWFCLVAEMLHLSFVWGIPICTG